MTATFIGHTREQVRAANSRELYLTLLKRVLTDTLYAAEPNADDDGMGYLQDFIRHYIKGRALTMVSLVRMDNLQHCASDVLETNVPGDFIETGVWRGGVTLFMRAILKAHGAEDRKVWVADSFEGLPEPDAAKYPIEAETHRGKVMADVYDHFAVTLEQVKENFSRFGLLDDQVRFLRGWFKDTLGTTEITQLALMRLDGDYYESTTDALVHLYPKLSSGGYVIIDDYGEDTWTYCRRAVDDYRRKENLGQPLVQVDSKCFYWKK